MATIFETERQRALFLDLLAGTIRFCRTAIAYRHNSGDQAVCDNAGDHAESTDIINKYLETDYKLNLDPDKEQQLVEELNELEKTFNDLTGLKQLN